jgi:hypothetical protein
MGLIQTGEFATACGGMNHVAFRVEEEELDNYRQKVINNQLAPPVSREMLLVLSTV